MIDERNLFDQPVNNYKKTCDNIQKIATGQESDYKLDFYYTIFISKKIIS